MQGGEDRDGVEMLMQGGEDRDGGEGEELIMIRDVEAGGVEGGEVREGGEAEDNEEGEDGDQDEDEGAQ